MKILKEYFDLQQKIYDHFGYRENWVTIPLDDQTGRHWGLIQEENGTGKVFWLDPDVDPSVEVIEAGKQLYGGRIYTQRFLPKWVYRADDYTMISVDTQTDGNKFLMIFDNEKEIKNQELIDTYKKNWSRF